MRYIWVLLGMLILVGCQQNEVEALDKAAKACVDDTSSKCIKLKHRIQKLHDLAMDLQASPQGFGLSVLRLQGRIVTTENKLKAKKLSQPNKAALQSELKKLRENYDARLTVIRWLEAPGA